MNDTIPNRQTISALRGVTSEAIDWLRFPLAVFVVMIHSGGTYHVPSDFSALSLSDVYDLLRILFSQVATVIAVPVFFVISGYLFYQRLDTWNWSVWAKKMKSRLFTLLIPYVLWNIIKLLFLCKALPLELMGLRPSGAVSATLEKALPVSMFWDYCSWGGGNVDWLGNPIPLMTGPVLLAFWFMRDLIVVVACTPVIFWLVKRFGLVAISLFGLCYFSGVRPDIDVTSSSFFYFSLGAWFSIHGRDICESLYPFRWVFYSFYLLMLLPMVYLYGPMVAGVKESFIFCGTLSAFCFSYWLVRDHGVRAVPFLTASTFFVYASHQFILPSCRFVGARLAGHEVFQILFYLATPFIVVALCVALFYILRRFFPRLASILTGART